MKRILVSPLLIGLFFAGGLTVKASETTTTETQETDNASDITIEVDAGINADSPFYFLDKGFENIHLWLTRDESKKVDLLLKIAEERMSELNDLEEDKVAKYVDKLLDEYSDKVNKANEKMNSLVSNNKLSEKTKLKLQDRLNHTVDVDQALKNKIKDKISAEIKTKIDEIKSRTYLTALASGLTNDEINALKDQGYGYGEILKLNSIAKITGKTIEDLKLLDIYNDLGEIDFSKVATELSITEEDVMAQIKEYRDTVKDEIRANIKEMVQEKKAEIEKQVKQRQEEIKNRLENNINNRLEERKSEITELIITKTNLHLQVLDVLVEQAFITNEDKQIILAQVNDMKANILNQIEDNELNRNDYEQMRLEITKYIQTQLKDRLDSIDLTQIDTSQLSQEATEVLGCLLGNPEEIINKTIDKVLQHLQDKGITLSDEQIQTIKSQINEQVTNDEFNIDEYDEILEQVTDVIKEELGREHTDLFDNINQYKDRYQERLHENRDEDTYEQEVIDLFNNLVSDLNLDLWNNLSVEKQNMIRHYILSEIDLEASSEDINTQIINLLMNKFDNFNQHKNNETNRIGD